MGLIGDVARELLDMHAEVCDAAVVDPIELGRRMTKFHFDDQDPFDANPVCYAKVVRRMGQLPPDGGGATP